METSAKANDVLKLLPGVKAKKEDAIWLYSTSATLGGVLADIGDTFVNVFCPPPERIRSSKPIELVCHAGDPKTLLINWLQVLQYILDSRHVTLADFSVRVSELMALSATCRSLPIFEARAGTGRRIDLASAQVTQPAAGLWEAEVRVVLKDEEGSIR